MFLKSVLVLVALVSCQGADVNVQKTEEVQDAINLLREAIHDTLFQNAQQCNTLISNVRVSIYESEYKGLKKIRKIVNKGLDHLIAIAEENTEEEYNVTKCLEDALENHVYWREYFSEELKDCCENIDNKVSSLIWGTLDHSKFEADSKLEDYKKEMADCILDNSESCLNELLDEVRQDIKVYPKMLQGIFDSVENLVQVYKKSMKRSGINTGTNMSNKVEELLSDLENCIESKMMHDILHE